MPIGPREADIETAPKAAIGVFIVDDHTLFREGVRLILELEPDLTCAGEAGTADEAAPLIRSARPALVLLDLRLSRGRGTELLSRMATWPWAPRVLVVTAFPDEADIAEALRLGAKGVVLKDATRETLVSAIRTVAAGQVWLPAELSARVIAGLAPAGRASVVEQLDLLTGREREIVALVGHGLKNRDIAARLGVAEKTIKGHLTSIFLKLGVPDRLELALLAIKTHMTVPREG